MSVRGLSCVMLALLLCAGTTSASTIDFEDIPLGTTYGPTNMPGDVVITTVDGIEVSVQQLLVNNSPIFGEAVVGGEFDPFFPTTPLSMNNIAFEFDFAGLAFDVNSVSLDYMEFGGVSNFAVNGGTPFQITEFTDLPSNVAPGVTAVVDEDMIVLLGDIDSFLIGGQEVGIDNIVAVPEPLALTLLAMGAGAVLGYRRTRVV